MLKILMIKMINSTWIWANDTRVSTKHNYITNSQWNNPDNKVHGANKGPTWFLSAPDRPHVGPMNLAVREDIDVCIFHGIYYILSTNMPMVRRKQFPLWRHDMGTVSALLAPLSGESTGHWWIPLTKGQQCGVLKLPLAWNCWRNTPVIGDFIRLNAKGDVTPMPKLSSKQFAVFSVSLINVIDDDKNLKMDEDVHMVIMVVYICIYTIPDMEGNILCRHTTHDFCWPDFRHSFVSVFKEIYNFQYWEITKAHSSFSCLISK